MTTEIEAKITARVNSLGINPILLGSTTEANTNTYTTKYANIDDHGLALNVLMHPRSGSNIRVIVKNVPSLGIWPFTNYYPNG